MHNPDDPLPLRRGLASARSVLARLGCSPAEGVALAVLVAGSVAGLGLLWVLAQPRPEPAGPLGARSPAGGTAAPLDEELPGAGEGAGGPGEGVGGREGRGTSGPGEPGEERPGPPGLVLADDVADGGAPVVVHVAGLVATPGLYRLPPGSRIGDALEQAGGPSPGARLDLVNLAQPVADGEQVYVPGPDDPPGTVTAGDAGPDGASGGTSGGAAGGAGAGAVSGVRPDGTVDLNRAGSTELETLPGVGPVLAERIVAHREDIGGFRTVDELRDVKGIGEKTFAELESRVTVG